MSERMLQPFFQDELMNWPFSSLSLTKTASSGISVWEEEDEIVVETALPGIRADHVNISFERRVLTVQANKREEKEDKVRKYFHKSDASFHYSVKVPGEIDDTSEPQAQLKEGVLQIRFKKHKRSTPRKISIQC